MASGIEDLVEGIQKACGSNVAVVRASSGNDIADLAKETSKSPRIITVTLASPQPGAHEADSTIASVLTQIEKLVGDDWTAMLTGVQGMHTMDRRATSATAATASVIPYSKRAIFQKYIFFSPGLFMCFFAMLPLFIVAFLGVNILMSIQTPSRFEVKKKEK
ncbi:hypothetical protein HKX48_007889 [Thoreauomyces humboldtii]|nr:hypothetical protein HKX48_007889 [Thoreauomyces humboldtii]